MSEEPDKLSKVVDLSEARKKQKTMPLGPGGRKVTGAKAAPQGGQRTMWTYLQFALFLGAIFYFMQLCSTNGIF